MRAYLALAFLSLLTTCKIIYPENQEPIISMKRTACYGQCPVYSIDIFRNGNGVYNGKYFVQQIGKVNFRVTKEEIISIISKANEINFFEMKEQYAAPITDLPSCFVIIEGKKVEDYFDAPNELKELQQMIDNLFFK